MSHLARLASQSSRWMFRLPYSFIFYLHTTDIEIYNSNRSFYRGRSRITVWERPSRSANPLTNKLSSIIHSFPFVAILWWINYSTDQRALSYVSKSFRRKKKKKHFIYFIYYLFLSWSRNEIKNQSVGRFSSIFLSLSSFYFFSLIWKRNNNSNHAEAEGMDVYCACVSCARTWSLLCFFQS